MKYLSAVLLCGALSLNMATASAETCSFTLEGNDQSRWDKDKIEVAASCTDVEITLKHAGMKPITTGGHNFVLAETKNLKDIAMDGMKAGPGADYIKADDKRVLAHSKLIGGGDTTTFTFPTKGLKKGGDYTYFCSFPGHWAMMKGTLTFG
jgi:azurin